MAWELILRSFRVLRQDPKLILFPILSALAGLAIAALYYFSPLRGTLLHNTPIARSLSAAQYAALFAGYCGFYFAMVFFNCALAGCAQVRFSGGKPSIGDGLARAAARVGTIFLWALLSATIGVVLRIIEDRVGWLARLTARVFEFAWGMATCLVVPVLIVEQQGVLDSIRRSSGLLRTSWGEQLTVGISLGWIMILLAIPGVVAGALAMNGFPALIPVTVVYFLLLIAVSNAVRQIFEVALYRYAATGDVPDGYNGSILRGAFESQPRR